MFGKKRKSNIKKQVRKRYKALKKSGDVKLGKEAGLSKKEMKEGIRKNIAEKGVLRKRNVMAKKALDNIARKESSVATSKDMATERSNRSAERQAYMQSKADAANKDIKSRKAIGSENERIRTNKMTASATKPGDTYEMIMPDGNKKMVRKPEPEDMETKKNKAMYGAKVKAVKKAPGGAAMKKMPTYEKGGALKSVPSDAKGLSKLPKGVRNKMGYMQDGGKVKSKSFGVLKSDANKAKKAGPKLENKPPYSRNGINYTWDRKQGVYVGDLGDNYAVKKMKDGGRLKRLKKKADKKLTKGYDIRAKVESSQRGETPAMSEKKMDRLRKRANKKDRKGFAALKKMKDGGKVVKRGGGQRPAKPFRTMKEIKEEIMNKKKTRGLIKK